MRVRKVAEAVAGIAAVVAVGAYGLVGAQAAPNEFLPFEGTFEGVNETTGPGMQDPFGEFLFAGSGTYQANHLGTGTFESAGTLEYVRHQQRSHGECAFVDGELILTAANGDQLNGNIDEDRSTLCQLSDDEPENALSTLYVQVDGGTGRFAEATGWYFVKDTSIAQEPGSQTFDESGYILGSIEY